MTGSKKDIEWRSVLRLSIVISVHAIPFIKYSFYFIWRSILENFKCIYSSNSWRESTSRGNVSEWRHRSRNPQVLVDNARAHPDNNLAECH